MNVLTFTDAAMVSSMLTKPKVILSEDRRALSVSYLTSSTAISLGIDVVVEDDQVKIVLEKLKAGMLSTRDLRSVTKIVLLDEALPDSVVSAVFEKEIFPL